MFQGLFDDEDTKSSPSEKVEPSKKSSIPKPAVPRGSTGLCGLSNLGATCYLNSLLQTLHFTPEFREALFSIEESELGISSERNDTDNSMVRQIPIQLQHLFARLLLLDQLSADVTSLTDSFGWTNSEELQQHDVQELNRILFSAIESSLFGTSGEQLISKLYHGSTVQQITCQMCRGVSGREEEFLDVAVALSGHTGLEEALKESFVKLEPLEGSNQYYCGRCQKLVNAKRGCHIRKLPPILTFALLRFLYDFKKGERYKDNSRFKFPMLLDMTPYCEDGSVKGDAIYELFSVVIHSGSTHSGHYTAYIRDVDDLGQWTHPDDEPVHLPPDPASGKVDLIDYENPADLLAALLEQQGGSASISKLCKTLQDQTGVTWNKRFKKQFGPISKFVKSCADIFTMIENDQIFLKSAQPSSSLDHERSFQTSDISGQSVAAESLQRNPSNNLEEATEKTGRLDISVSACGRDVKMESPDKAGEEEEETTELRQQDMEQEGETLDVGGVAPPINKSRPKPIPSSGQRWFEFNDTRVSPILSHAIDKMFQGKQSAYMLFYRKRSLKRPVEARGCPTFGVPHRLIAKVIQENSKIIEERVTFETAVNIIRVNLHHHSKYYYGNAALQKLDDSDPFIIDIDRRKTIKDMKDLVSESYPDMMCIGEDSAVIHTARFLPAGLHLYDIVSDKDEASLAALDITDESHLFFWDGVEVNGDVIRMGEESEPIQLHVTHPSLGAKERKARGVSENEVVMGFHKNSTLGEIRVTLSVLLGVQPSHVTISQVKVQERRGVAQSSVVILSGSKDKCLLSQVPLVDGDRLAAEREIKKGVQTLAHSVADKQNKMLSFIVEDRCSPQHDSSIAYPVFPVEMGKDELVATLKRKALSGKSIEGDVRFRVETDTCVLGPPLYEYQPLTEAEIVQGQKVIMEPGKPPQATQVVLKCSLSSSSVVSGGSKAVSEVIVEKKMTVGECCSVMVMTLGLTGDCWHLCKTDWCGEENGVLDDEMATLEEEKVKSGDLLLVVSGKLPPKGYIRLPIFLFTPHDEPSLPLRPLIASVGSPSSLSGGTTESERTTSSSMLDSSSQEGSVVSSMEDSATETVDPSLSPSQFYPKVPGEFLEVGTVEVNRDSTVDDLKMQILTLPAFSDSIIPTNGFLRIRELVKGRPGKIYKQGSHTLRRLKLSSDTQICCQLLKYEENLTTSTLVFNICMRSSHERTYGPLTEVVYNIDESCKGSSTPHGLRSHLSRLLDIPLDKFRIAKHKIEAFNWTVIEDSYQSESKRGRKKGGHGTKANIKNSPFLLRDGDTIGIKDLRVCDESDKDFSTPEDDKGKMLLLAIQEDKRKRRKAKEDHDLFGPKEKRQRRPERGIKIFVPDYRSK